MHSSLAIGQQGCIPPNTLLGVRWAQGGKFAHKLLWKFCLFFTKSGSWLFSCLFSEIHWTNMPVTWKEREHEEEEMLALHDPVTVNVLRNCGLFKFFHISSMRQQINLLQYFLDAWDPTNQVFQIRGKSIPLIVVDIYFLTGLSRRGAPISLSGAAHGGESVRDYIRRY